MNCNFSISVEGTSGTSDVGFWTPKDIRFLKKLSEADASSYREMLKYAQPSYVHYLEENGLPDPATLDR